MDVLHSWRPDLLQRDAQPTDSRFALAGRTPTSASKKRRCRLPLPELFPTLWNQSAIAARKSSVPPPGKDALLAPGASVVGTFLKDSKSPKTSALFAGDNPMSRELALAQSDRRLLHSAPPPASISIPVRTLQEWDRIARSALQNVAACHTFLDMLIQRAMEIWPEDAATLEADAGDDSGSAREDESTFAKDPVIGVLLDKVAEHMAATADGIAKNHFNVVLAYRDAILSKSTLSREHQAALRCIPAQHQSLFGDYAGAFIKHSAEERKEDTLARAAASRSPFPRSDLRARTTPRTGRSTHRPAPYSKTAPARTFRPTPRQPRNPQRPVPATPPKKGFRFGTKHIPRK